LYPAIQEAQRLPKNSSRVLLSLASSLEGYKFLERRFAVSRFQYDAIFSTNQARRGGDHNFAANGCRAGCSLAFGRAAERALAFWGSNSSGTMMAPRHDPQERRIFEGI
jgi:hypothetical protein